MSVGVEDSVDVDWFIVLGKRMGGILCTLICSPWEEDGWNRLNNLPLAILRRIRRGRYRWRFNRGFILEVWCDSDMTVQSNMRQLKGLRTWRLQQRQRNGNEFLVKCLLQGDIYLLWEGHCWGERGRLSSTACTVERDVDGRGLLGTNRQLYKMVL